MNFFISNFRASCLQYPVETQTTLITSLFKEMNKVRFQLYLTNTAQDPPIYLDISYLNET
jgi:hypothetical protein